MPTDAVKRDGFEFAYGHFRVLQRVERVEPSALRKMFLPKLTPEANRTLRKDDYFVHAQLKYYGVEYDPKELTGNGANLMKKMLSQGKLDKVPDKIEKLESEMAEEWYNQLTIEELVEHSPQRLLDQHFLDASGKPDRSKFTEVLVMPLAPGSYYRANEIKDLLNKVDGLLHERKGDALYVGWDLAKIRAKALAHLDELERKKEEERQAREEERQASHLEYLESAKREKKAWSPVGSYIVDCDAIEDQWPDQAEDMTLDVCRTGQGGIFKVHFHFGVLEGMMILGTKKVALDRYCTQLERESRLDQEDYSQDDDDDDEEEDYGNGKGSKRPAKRGRGRPPAKKAKTQGTSTSTSLPKKFFLQMKSRETGEGEIQEMMRGTIGFKDAKFASFEGMVDVSFIGDDVKFFARKVSDIPNSTSESWNDFSEYQYSRW